MKPITLTFLTLAISFSFHSYGQKIPTVWTPSMKIQAHYGGGMMYYTYDLLIIDSVSYMKILSNKGEEKYSRKFTQQELNAILIFLNEHRFNKIKSEIAAPSHDKASESISLSWEYNFIGASESSSMVVTDEYKDDFNTIQSYIVGLLNEEE